MLKLMVLDFHSLIYLLKMMEIVARVAAMTIAEIPRVRIVALEM